MAVITVAAGTTQVYTTPGTTEFSSVTLGALSVLDFSGQGVNVTVDAINATALSTIKVENGATLSLSGVSASLLTAFIIGDNGTLNAGSALSVASPITFSGTGGVLTVPEGVALLSPVNGLTSGNEIKTTGTVQSFTYTPALLSPTTNGTLTVVDTDGMSVSVQLDGNYTQSSFAIDANGGISVACYCRGTLIATDSGETPVECLKAGDRVRTLSGKLSVIRWIGRRSYAGRFLGNNPNVIPVRISAGALGDGLPFRDLCVSPEHAMYFDGILVPARALINGTSIRQARDVTRVEYFHIELDEHDIILAEGAASETFVDDDSRNTFENAAAYRENSPAAAHKPACYCAPKLEAGHEVELIRRRLALVVASQRQAA